MHDGNKFQANIGMWKCFLFVCSVYNPTRECFHAGGCVTITGEWLHILTYAWHSWPLSSEKGRKEMCNQYEARKIYFNYACVKICIIGYMTSPCFDGWNQRFLLQNTLAQGHTRLRIPIYLTSFTLNCICCANHFLCSKICKKSCINMHNNTKPHDFPCSTTYKWTILRLSSFTLHSSSPNSTSKN